MERKAAAEQLNVSSRKDVYAIVTEQIIAQLEKGTVPWRQPWIEEGIPRNLISKRPYRGINLMLLSMLRYDQNLFLTYNQIQGLGGHVKKGEHGHLVVYWNFLEVSLKCQDEEEDSRSKKKVPYLRYYMVFNVAQCEGIPKERIPSIVTWEYNPFPVCEEIIEKMPVRPRIEYGQEAGAFYDPLRDYVNMPNPTSFENGESFYATLFHELVHSTGHPTRLNRKDLLQMQEFNKLEAYSHEELVAEIGSCYLLSFAGMGSGIQQSADYIKGWLAKLRSDTKFIFSAATQAQKATDFILNLPSEVMVEQSNKPDIKSGFINSSYYYAKDNCIFT